MKEALSQPVKVDLNEKSLPKQKTIQNFTLMPKGSEKLLFLDENPPTGEIEVTS